MSPSAPLAGPSVPVLAQWFGLRPAGDSPDATHLAVPDARNPRFHLPVDRRAGAAACWDYNALRPRRTRLVRAALGVGMRTGLVQRFGGERCVSGPPNGPDRTLLGEPALVEVLADHLGVADLTFAVGSGSGDIWWKPTLQLFSRDGRAVGYAKVGHTEWTRRSVATEAEALAAWGRTPPRTFSVPELLVSLEWAGCLVSVTSPLPPRVRRWRGEICPTVGLDEVGSGVASGGLVSPVGTGPLAVSPWWEAVWAAARDNRSALPLEGLLAGLSRFASESCSWGGWHGDWVPWNMATDGGRLWVWDWETAAGGVPRGLEVVHSLFQHHHVVRGLSPEQAAAAAYAGCGDRLSLLDGAAPLEVLRVVHGLEMAARWARAASAGADPGDRIDRFCSLAAEWARRGGWSVDVGDEFP